MKKVLVGAPIRQKAIILKEFLASLANLVSDNLEINYMFIDDNVEKESKELLEDFKNKQNTVEIITPNSNIAEHYVCTEFTHEWKSNIIWKVADFKNQIIKKALENNYDYLFFADSDLILHPLTLQHLISRQVEIVSEVFWTIWKPETIVMPQVWLKDEYSFVPFEEPNKIPDSEMLAYQKRFISKIIEPNIYEVGGLGACTLISQKALNSGISFSKIDNISFWGEDRHFSIRAKVLGFNLYADTTYPPLHLYRTCDLLKIDSYKKFWENIDLTSKNYISEFIELIFDYKFNSAYENYLKKLIETSQFKELEKVAESLFKLSQEEYDYIYYLALACFYQEEYKKALELFSNLVSIKFKKKELYSFVSQCIEKLGDKKTSSLIG